MYFIYLMVISVVGIKSMPKFSKNKNVVTSFTAFKAVNIQCNDERIYKQSFWYLCN